MPILDVNMNERVDLKLLPDNTEKQVQIKFIDVVPQKKDASRSNVALVLEVTDDPLVDDIRHWVVVPSVDMKEQDPKGYARTFARFEEFIKAFGIQLPLDTDSAVGLTAWAVIGEGTDQQGAANNQIRRFIVRR